MISLDLKLVETIEFLSGCLNFAVRDILYFVKDIIKIF
jgi:hypothetical protein